MKKVLLLLSLLFFQSIFAQDIILTFKGVEENSGLDTTLDEVIIDNLTNGKTIELTSNFTFNLTGTLGVQSADTESTKKGIQKVYPNPFNNETNIQFYSEGLDKSEISIFNLLGQEVAEFSNSLYQGVHKISFTPNSAGIYLVVLNDNRKAYYSKIIAKEVHNNISTLAYNNVLGNEKAAKGSSKKSVNAFFTIGDDLRLTGYSNNLISTADISPIQSETITFSFRPTYALSILRYEEGINPNAILPKATYIDNNTNYQFTSYFKHDDVGDIDRLTQIVGDDGSGISTIISFDENGVINVLYQQDGSTNEVIAKLYVTHENGVTYYGDENETNQITENAEINNFENFLNSPDDILLAQRLNQNIQILEQLTSLANGNGKASRTKFSHESVNVGLVTAVSFLVGNAISYNLGAVSFNQGVIPINPGGVSFNTGGVSFNTGVGLGIYDYLLFDGCTMLSTCELREDGTYTCGSLYLNAVCWEDEEVMNELEDTTDLTIGLCSDQVCPNSIFGTWTLVELYGLPANQNISASGTNCSNSEYYTYISYYGAATFTENSFYSTIGRNQEFNDCATNQCADPNLCWNDPDNITLSGTYINNGNNAFLVTSGGVTAISLINENTLILTDSAGSTTYMR